MRLFSKPKNRSAKKVWYGVMVVGVLGKIFYIVGPRQLIVRILSVFVWVPHVVLRLLGRRGLYKVEDNEPVLDLSLRAFQKR